MAWPNYDDGDAGSTVPTVAYTPDPIAPTCLVWGASGGAYTLTTLSNGFPVQPGTSTTWAISASSLPLPSGAATAALQTTGNTSLATLAGAVSGTEVQVDVVAALPAGTNAIGKLAANDGVDIGDVTINNASIAVTGTFWQATQPVSIASAVAVTDNSGSLTVDAPVGTPVFVRLSDGSSAISTMPVQGAAAHDSPVAGNPVLFGGYAWGTGTPTAVADGDAARLWCSNFGAVFVEQRASAAWTVTISEAVKGYDADNDAINSVAGTLYETGNGSATILWSNLRNSSGVQIASATTTPGASDLGLVVRAAGTTTVTGTGGTFPVTDSGGSLTVDAPVGTPVFVRLSDGSSAITTLPVSLASVPSHAVTNAGTFAVQVDGAALTSLQLIDDVVFAEDAAHTTGDKGVQALTVRRDTAASTAGTDGDYASFTTDSTGRLWCNVPAIGGVTVTTATGAVNGTGTSAPAIAIVGAEGGAFTNWVVTADGVGLVRVDGGTVAATQSGTWNVGTVTTLTSIGGVTIAASNGAVTGAGTSAPGITAMAYDSANTRLVPLLVNDDGYLQIVGTVAAVQSGTWTVQPGNTANTTPWLVTVSTALPAGTNAIGKLAANSGVTIGAVEIAANQDLRTLTTCSTVTSLSQFAGNAIATNTGDVSAGTLRVREAGAPSLTCGQVSVATTATEICAARAGRRAVIITQHGTTAVYLGSSGSVTTSNGLLLTGTAGAIQVIPGSSAVHGIVASGTQTVSYAEVY